MCLLRLILIRVLTAVLGAEAAQQLYSSVLMGSDRGGGFQSEGASES